MSKKKMNFLRQIVAHIVNWLKNLAETKSRKERMKMIERGDQKLSITRQAELLYKQNKPIL